MSGDFYLKEKKTIAIGCVALLGTN